MSGTVEDQEWGKWVADGWIPTNGSASQGRLTLTTAGPKQVTPELLCRVPFVNPNAWTHVGLEGTTSARLELTFDTLTAHVAYRMTMEPTQTSVRVPSIGLEFTNASGGLVAEGAVVTLSDVRGKAADGEVRLDSQMDFSGPDSVLRFTADLIDMEVRKLPKLWRLPPELEGRLSGVILPCSSARGGIEAAGGIIDVCFAAKFSDRVDVQTGPGRTDFANGRPDYGMEVLGRYRFARPRAKAAQRTRLSDRIGVVDPPPGSQGQARRAE